MQGSKSKISDVGAIGFAFAGFTFWVLTDTFVKLIGQTGLPAYEVVAFLGLFMSISMAAYAVIAQKPHSLRPHRISLQLVRACLDMTNNVCVVIALRHLTLTLFYILVFMAPMLIALLSTMFLREGLHWKKTVALVAGFAGVVIAVHPWSNSRAGDWIGFAACMICVVCFSINMMWSRVLTRTEPPESLTLFSGLVTTVVGFGLMMLVQGFSMGTVVVPATTAAMDDLPSDRSGAGSAVTSGLRQLGGTLGIAVGSTILSAWYRSGLRPALSGLPDDLAQQAIGSVQAALSVARTAGRPELVEAATSAYLHAMRITAGTSVVLCLSGLVLIAVCLGGKSD